MQTVYELKEQAVTDTPVLVFDCVLPGGQTEHWCTHTLTVGATAYAARVLQHSKFDIQTASDQGVDGSPRISIILANADSHFSEIERATGWKGAKLTVGFLFYDLRNQVPLTATTIIFQGICNPPEERKWPARSGKLLNGGNSILRNFLSTVNSFLVFAVENRFERP
jgi:hypothetical protein